MVCRRNINGVIVDHDERLHRLQPDQGARQAVTAGSNRNEVDVISGSGGRGWSNFDPLLFGNLGCVDVRDRPAGRCPKEPLEQRQGQDSGVELCDLPLILNL